MIKELFVSDLPSVEVLQKDFKDGWTISSIKAVMNAGLVRLFGKFEKDILVGYIALSESDIVDIETVLVKEEFRNRGIGLELIEKAISFAKEVNASSVMLEVRASNLSAINLYKKAGFKQISVRKEYYYDHEDALIFQREIEK